MRAHHKTGALISVLARLRGLGKQEGTDSNAWKCARSAREHICWSGNPQLRIALERFLLLYINTCTVLSKLDLVEKKC